MSTEPSRGRGRPRGPSTAKGDILEAARQLFLADGYRSATLRSIADRAGVDVALISYHYGSKRDLFAAALGLAASPAQVIAASLPGPVDALPERLLTSLLAVWDDPQHAAMLGTLLGDAITVPDVGRLFRGMAEREMTGQIAEHIGGRDARGRAGTAVSMLAGLILTRYVLRLEPMASMSSPDVLRHYAGPLRQALAPHRLSRRPS